MPDPISISGIASACLTNAFLAGVAGNLFASVLYDAGKQTHTKLGQLVTDGLQAGKLPENHDLEKLAQSSLRSALFFVHASCVRSVGEKDPFFPSLLRAWKDGKLFDRPLIEARDTLEHDWLDRFGSLIKDEKRCLALGNEPSGIEDAQAIDLASRQLDAALEQAVTDRLSALVNSQVELSHKLDRSVAFQQGLDLGFPVDGDTTRRLSVYAAWCLFFREGLKDAQDERPFKAYVIAKLDQISQQQPASFDTDTFADQLSRELITALETRIPDITFFDLHFEKIGLIVQRAALETQKHVTAEVKRAIKELTSLIESLSARLAELESKPSQVPRLPPLQNEFVGRDTEQQNLLKRLRGDGASDKLAGIAGVGGQGGIGKTALALHVGHQIASDFPDGRVYLDLRGTTQPLSPRQAMESILRQFNPQANFKDAPDDQIAADYRAFLGPQRVLLLLDNAADAKQVNPLLPGGTCGVLVTSRRHFNLNGHKPLTLELLSEAEAADLAQSLAPRLTDDEAADLAQACGRLALAVRLVATQISVYEGIPAADHIQDLRSDRLAYLDTVDNDDPEGLPFARRAIELSLEKLLPELRAFWARLSVFPIDFEYQLASYVALDTNEPNPKQGRKMLEQLRHHALLEFDPESQRYRLHDLAREYAQTRVLDDDARSALAKHHAAVFMSFLDLADRAYLEGRTLEGLAMLDAEMPSVLAGQAWAATHLQTDDEAGRLAAKYYDAGVYVLRLRLHSRTQIAWLETAVAACRKLGDRRGEGNALGNLGNAHAELGDARKAIEFYEQRIVIAREIGDRRGEGTALGNLGNAHADLGDTRKAIEFYEQQLVIVREIGDRRGEGNALGNLGNAHAELGDARKAIEFYEQQLVIVREIGDRRGEGNALGNLGNAHAELGDARAELGDARKAIEFYEQQLVIVREIGDRRGEGNALGNLGIAHAILGDARKAIEFYEQQLVIVREIGDRRGEGNALGNLGNAHAELGDARKAIEFYEQRIVIAREIGDRRGEANALFNRASKFAEQEAWGPAAEDMEQAAAIFAAIESPNADRAAQRATELRRQADGNA